MDRKLERQTGHAVSQWTRSRVMADSTATGAVTDAIAASTSTFVSAPLDIVTP